MTAPILSAADVAAITARAEHPPEPAVGSVWLDADGVTIVRTHDVEYADHWRYLGPDRDWLSWEQVWTRGGSLLHGADAAFIAAARTDVPALAASHEAVRERAEKAEALLVEHAHLLTRIETERDDALARLARVEALCDEAQVGLSKGCVCSADDWEVPIQHTSPECGRPLAWTLDPAEVRAALAPAEDGGECASCSEGDPTGECPKSQRPCGHHCNHIWTHHGCDWCGYEEPEDGGA